MFLQIQSKNNSISSRGWPEKCANIFYLAVFAVFSREPQLYKRVCPSVGWSVGPLVTLSSNLMKNGILRIVNNLGSAG